MLISVATLVGLKPEPLEDLVGQLRDTPLQALEVNCGPTFPKIGGAQFEGHLDVDAVIRDGPGPTEDLLGESGIRITALAPMLNLLVEDQPVREARIGYFENVIKAAAILGVSTVVTYGGSPRGMWFQGLPAVGHQHPSNHLDMSLLAFQEVFTPLARLAEESGIKIAMETAPRGGGHGNVAHSPALWDRLFEIVPSPSIGLSFDPSHLVWLHIPDVPGVIRMYADRIHHFDGKDAEILPDRLARQGILGNSWWRYRLPGLGALDWTLLISALREIGYDYTIAIEQEDPVLPGIDGAIWAARHLNERLLPGPLLATDAEES